MYYSFLYQNWERTWVKIPGKVDIDCGHPDTLFKINTCSLQHNILAKGFLFLYSALGGKAVFRPSSVIMGLL